MSAVTTVNGFFFRAQTTPAMRIEAARLSRQVLKPLGNPKQPWGNFNPSTQKLAQEFARAALARLFPWQSLAWDLAQLGYDYLAEAGNGYFNDAQWITNCDIGGGGFQYGASDFCTTARTQTWPVYIATPRQPKLISGRYYVDLIRDERPHPLQPLTYVQFRVSRSLVSRLPTPAYAPGVVIYDYPDDPQPGYVPAPQRMPTWVDPSRVKPLTPAYPEVPPPWRTAPYRNPDHGLNYGTSSGYGLAPRVQPGVSPDPAWDSASVRPATGMAGPSFGWEIRPEARDQVRPYIPPPVRNPGIVGHPPRTQEGKVFLALGGVAAHLVGGVTELADLVKDLWDALPCDVTHSKRGKKLPRSFNDKLRDIRKNWDRINWEAAMINVAASQIKDRAYGALGRGAARGARNMGLPHGAEFGTSTNKREMSDIDKEILKKYGDQSAKKADDCAKYAGKGKWIHGIS